MGEREPEFFLPERNPEIFLKKNEIWDSDIIFIKNKNFPEKDRQEKFIKEFLNEELFRKKDIEIDREFKPADIAEIRNNLLKEIGIKPGKREFELPGSTLKGLAGVLDREPQIVDGRIRYLVTSGLAVEAITGFSRQHHDTDLVICDSAGGWWLKLLTDNKTPDDYWADMRFEKGFMESTSWSARFIAGGREYIVLTAHPAILLVQKLSNAWGRQPREKDRQDAQALVRFWKEHGMDKSWEPIVQKALEALPTDSERTITRWRLKDALSK